MSENQLPFIPGWLDSAGLSMAEFRHYCHLRRCADNKTGIAWPSYKTMTSTCGTGKTTTRRCLEELERRGLIAKIGKPFGGSCRYRVLAPIVSPQGQMDVANSSTTGTIEAAPIVPPQDRNNPSGGTPIVPPQGQEGKPKKVNQKKVNQSGSLFGYEDTLPFSSEPFKAAWQTWERHRKQKRSSLTDESIKMQFKDMIAMGEERSIAAINHSVKNGFTGLYEPTGTKASQPTQPAKPGTTTINCQTYRTT
jgi:hypothetical protein